jgi:hypothetical protein
MKKQIIIFTILAALLTVITNKSNAQKIYIGITGGLSSPSGNFAKSDYNDNSSGFASSGSNIGVTGIFFLNKRFGIGGLISYQHFGFKGLQSLADGYKDAFDVDSTTVNTLGNNHTINILVGPYYSIPLTKLHIDFRLLVGLVNATLAGNEVYLEDNAATTFSQKQATASAFGTQLGVSLRYPVTHQVSIAAGIDYFYSNPNFTIENVNRHNNAGRILTNYNQPIAGLNANLSLLFALSK